jgi:transposase
MSTIEITRKDLSVSQLRAAAARTADAKQARRLLAIAMGLDGHSRRLAAQAGGMDRQTLRDWVIRYNADGLTGLADRPRPGRQPRLTEAQRCEVAEWVESGPNLKTDGVVRWRCADLRDRIAAISRRLPVTLRAVDIQLLLDPEWPSQSAKGRMSDSRFTLLGRTGLFGSTGLLCNAAICRRRPRQRSRQFRRNTLDELRRGAGAPVCFDRGR